MPHEGFPALKPGEPGGPPWKWYRDLWARPDLDGYETYLIDRGGAHADIRAYAGIGDGTADNTEPFELAIESIVNSRSGSGSLLIADGRYIVGANITIPEQITLVVRQGARIVPAEGVAIRINGPIEAGPYRIFEGGSAAVPPEPPRVNAVVVTPAAFSLEPPNTRQLGATALDSSGAVISGATFSWSSDDPAIATVSSSGLVTAVANGTATITARSGGVDGTSMITVQTIPDPPNLARIDVTPSSATIEDGQTQQFNADGFDSADSPVAITPVWASTNTNVATVDATGLATAVAPGQCMITATDSGVQGAATLNVTTVAAPEVTTIVVTPTQTSIEETETVQLTAQAFDQNGQEIAGVQFLWSSSNTSRATVDQTGLVTGVASGFVGITATANNVDGTASVNVLAPPGDVTPIFEDDFEAYPLGSDIAGEGANGFQWQGGGVGGGIEVTNEHSFSGTKSLVFRYPGEPDLSEDSSREKRFILAADGASSPSELWFEYMVRVPDNWEHRDPIGGSGNKLISMWAERYNNSLGDAEITIEWQRATTTRSFLRQAVVTDANRLADDQPSQQLIKGTIFDASMRGTWIRLRYHYRIGGTDAVNDPTIIDIWRDNTKICEARRDYNMKGYPPENPPGLNYFRHGYLFGWSNSGFTEDTNFYVDDLKFWTQDPGWTF